MNQHVPPTKTFVTIEGRALKTALAPILFVVERRNTYPILGCVKLTLAGSKLTLTGTDLDIEVVAELDVIDGEGEWSVAIDAQTMTGIARVAGVMPVRIERVERTFTPDYGKDRSPKTEVVAKIRLGDGDAEYELQALDADAFPSLGGKRGALIETFTNGMLGALLGKVAPFISTEETRYYLNGVCWQQVDDGRRVVATDGHRLGMTKYASEKHKEVWNRIIPGKTVFLIMKHMGGDVTAFGGASEGKKPFIEFVTEDLTIRSKLIDGTYPDITRIVGGIKENQHEIGFSKLDIIAAVDRAAVLGASRQGRAIRLFPQDGHVALDRKSADQGKATAHTQAAWPDPTLTDFALNAAYLRDMVGRCEGDISLWVKDAGSPVAMADADESMIRILMPMRA